MGFFTCALCRKEFDGHGHNPVPLGLDAEKCCDACNLAVVDARVNDKLPKGAFRAVSKSTLDACKVVCDAHDAHNAVHADENKMSNALKHVDVFLASHCKNPRISCRDLTCYGVKTSGTVEEANMWWDDMIGNFFSCLHTANKRGDPSRGRISYETATGHASSARVHCMNKFRGCGPELNVFRPIKWRQLRDNLRNGHEETGGLE